MIERLRYFLAILNLIVIPSGMLFWFLIHPWARLWRRLGVIPTYLIVVPVSVVFGGLLFGFRGPLLGKDLGTNWSLVAIALLLYGVMTWLEFHTGSISAFECWSEFPSYHPPGTNGAGCSKRGSMEWCVILDTSAQGSASLPTSY
jgi:hypothetical protein